MTNADESKASSITDEEDVFLAPLSFAQERLWLLDQLDPGDAAYIVPTSVRLEGAVDEDALFDAFEEIVRRHEVLRTTLNVIDGSPMQVIHQPRKSPRRVIDLRAMPRSDAEARLATLAEEEGRAPFDLSTGPLLRTTLIRIAPNLSVLLLTMHHIVTDGWSSAILLRELTALYAAFVAGQPSPLPDLAVQYADFAEWQREYLQGETLEDLRAYWRRQLTGASTAVELPFDRPRPPVQRHVGAEHVATIPKSAIAALTALAQREKTTLFVTLLAAFDVLMARYCGQTDVVVGTAIANRNREEIEPLIGFFVNSLVLRVDTSGDPPFSEIVRRARRVAMDAFTHQDLPFEQLVAMLAPVRDPSRNPLFQVMFILQTAPEVRVELPGIDFVAEEYETGSTRHDLRFSIEDRRGESICKVTYNVDLFDADTIVRMTESFVLLLTACSENADQSISRLPLMPTSERHRLLVEFNDTAAPFPADALMHDLFVAQAARQGDAPALVFRNETLSYRELERRARRIAHALRAHGVERGTLVAIVMQKGWEPVAAMLGIHMAGGAYLPIDPHLPRDRVEFLLSHAGATVALTQSWLEPLLDWPDVARWAADEIALAPGEPSALPRFGDSSDLAYVIYTSGSTGRPKGVAIAHQGAVNTIVDVNTRHRVGPGDRVLALSAFNFDLSVYDVFGVLGAGATIVMPDEAGVPDPAPWAELVRVHQVTLWNSVPALLEMVVTYAAGRANVDLRSLRTVLLSGDWIPVSLPDRIRALAPYARVTSMGGATEASIWSNDYPIERVEPWWTSVPYGRPMTNQRFYVLDDALEPCPVGVPGDLYIGGVGLAIGYWNDAEKTAASFVTHPRTGERLYRTGDRGRHTRHGWMEFLGRKDFQVKIRGFRIELGEIESVLRAVAAVQEAVVMAREDTPGDKRLVAYVVGTGDASFDESVLRERLSAKLPDYMIPSAFVRMEALPLSANGKVDRKALPAPNVGGDPSAGDALAAPRDDLEQSLADLFSQITQRPIGIHQSFFDAGGNSLMATQLASRIRIVLGIDIPLRSLFEAPTVAQLAARIRATDATPEGLPALVRAPDRHRAPASFGQQRLWFLDRLEPNSAAYNIPLAIRITGNLSVTALERALAYVVRRHDALRTTFAEDDRGVMQIVHDEIGFVLRRVDLSSLDDATREGARRRMIHDEAVLPFDLDAGPLARATLVTCGPSEWLLLLTMHHIVSDGWSMNVLVREVAQLYPALVRGETATLEPLGYQYVDYAAWQASQLGDVAIERDLTYWREHLRGAPSAIELPTDRVRPAVQTTRGSMLSLEWDAALGHRLQQRAREHGATMFMVLLAAYATLLARYSGQRDIVIGTPIANRTRAEFEDLIGLFVNTLALRVNLAGEPTFAELLARVRESALGGFAHQSAPFDKVVEALQPPRDLSRTPLFQVMFVMQNAGREPIDATGATIEPLEVDFGIAKFDLLFTLDDAAGLRGLLEFNTDQFDTATAQRIARHFGVVLEAVARDPQVRIDSIPLVDEDERAQLARWNATDRDLAWRGGLHTWVEAQVRRTPDAIALSDGQRELTYAQLNADANRLARRLRALGIGCDALVGVMMDRSIEMVVALVAVVKAGGGYVPIDPEHPEARQRYVLEDSGVGVLLTQSHLHERAAAVSASTVLVAVDAHEERAQLARESADDLELSIDPMQLAYMIYTSGSTGRPKGAMNTHVGIVNRLRWMQDEYGLNATDVVLQKTPFGFDVSVWEFFWPLMTGARLVIARPGGHRDPGYLSDVIARERVTTLHFVPSMLAAYLADSNAAFAPSVRRVICSGEALPYELQQRFFARSATSELHNLYGPTEAAVDVTYWACERTGMRRTVPIGRPVANTRVHILDERMQPVPLGVAGELFLAGVQLARGYHGRADLTAERFVPDPFVSDGGRLYRTGDRARRLPDGSIDYLGRVDFQVKVRGFRIELGEIEAALLQTDWVRESVVTTRDVGEGDKQLVAYLVGSDAPRTAGELRDELKKTLPDYMIPSAFVWLEAMPLNASGKVDRSALPTPDLADTREQAFVEPRNEVEEAIASVWRDLLRVSQIGIDDNFFHIGGHSLLATRVASRLKAALGREVPLRVLFEAPTIRDLARSMEHHVVATEGPIECIDRGSDLELSFAQERMWFLDQLNPGTSTYNMPAIVELEGALDPDALRAAIDAVVARHETLRTTFRSQHGKPVQVIAPKIHVPWSIESVDTNAVRGAIEAFARQPFDLEHGPLLRTRVLRVSATRHVLMLVMHHIVGDGWSFDVLLREVAAMYASACAGAPPHLPPLTVQYADFAAWQRRTLAGARLERELAYWKTTLMDAPASLDLPTDHPRAVLKGDRGGTVDVAIGRAVREGVERIARESGTTPFMVLLAAWAVLMSRHSRQNELVIGTPVANRRRVETEPLIGFFVNTLSIRIDLTHSPSFAELLGRVRAATLGAFDHQDVPFERVVEALGAERDGSRTPVFQTLFALQNIGREAISLPGLTMRVIEEGTGSARFDLSLALTEAADEFAGVLEYDAALFEHDSIERYATRYIALLGRLTAEPDLSVDRIPLIVDREQREIDAWTTTLSASAEANDALLAHEQLASWAHRTPDAIACIAGETSRTFAEIDARANRLAHVLRRAGIGPERLVAIWIERDADLVEAPLAALKAGGAYLPLDASTPPARVRAMITDAGASVLLTTPALAASIANEPTRGVEVLTLPAAHERALQEPSTPPDVAVDASNLAYVIYTSGSTGTPKGVAITHAGLRHLVNTRRRLLALDSGDRGSMIAAFGFDASVYESWPLLSAGASVHVAPSELRADPRAIRDWLAQSRITVAFAPTPLGEALLEQGVETIPSMRILYVGGDRLTRGTTDNAHFELFNEYGPTECTVVATTGRVGVVTDRMPTIGRPVEAVRIYLLDEHGARVPIGVAGEVYIGGAGVGRGYLHRAELTAERFVPDPFASEVGARMYRTGDLARFLADGEIEFLGRIDQQVKLRGFRIELGEIEASLARLEGVVDACVIVREDAPGQKRLVAYIVHDERLSVLSQLRVALARTLPEYMVPSIFVPIERLPLNASGKVDRRALPAPARDSSDAMGPAFVAPRTVVEEIVAAAWTQALGLDRLSVDANVFEAGAHSLLATTVVHTLREKLQREVQLRWIFETRTIAGLAARITAATAGESTVVSAPMRRVDRSVPLPTSFAQRRLWFLQQLEPESVAYNIPVALRLAGWLDEQALRAALASLIDRHETLRTVFVTVDGEPMQRIEPAPSELVTRDDLSSIPASARDEALRSRLVREAARPFDLARGPLVRAVLYVLGRDEHVVQLTLHHIIADGVSIEVMVREFGLLYTSAAAGIPSTLEPLEFQYADFATWQQERLRGESLDALLRYWKQRLEGAPPAIALPTDHAFVGGRLGHGAVARRGLSRTLRDRVDRFAREQGTTPFAVLLAVFDVLLARYSGQHDVLVATAVANRSHPSTQPLIGFFANTLILRTEFADAPTFTELARRVRDGAIDALAHQELPFERLVEAIRPERQLGRMPLAQVAFNYQNAVSSALSAGDLTIEAIPLDLGTARRDLSLNVVPDANGLQLACEYSTELFIGETIDRLLQHFERLLESALATPDTPVDRLELLSDDEAVSVRRAEHRDHAATSPLDAFDERVRLDPKAIAVRASDGTLTFAALDQRARALASVIVNAGVKPGAIVALSVDRTSDFAIGVVGILRAGAAWLPVDPAYPLERREFMLRDAGACAVVVDASARGAAGHPGVLSIDLGTVPNAPSQPVPLPVVAAESPAYVIYTSGSTGVPKGVVVSHGSLGAYLGAMRTRLGITPRDIYAHTATISFSSSVRQLLVPLSAGASVWIATQSEIRDPGWFVRAARETGATVLDLVPSYWRVLEEAIARLDAEARREALRNAVRLIVSASEPLPVDIPRIWAREFAHPAQLVNMYGQTETTGIVATHRIVAEDWAPGRARIPIGMSLAPCGLYVLDAHRRAVPVGVLGELYVAGETLADGYLGRSELTVERFVPDSISSLPGARMYRTGDLARMRADGSLEHLGRVDSQTKIRGFRVEVGEVEAALRALSSIADAIVRAVASDGGEQRLIAYVVPRAREALQMSDIRSALQHALPEYMIPSRFVVLDAFPRTATGKIDTSSLPAPEHSLEVEAATHEPPRTESERIVADAWGQALGRTLGRNDDFFEAGGHSLLATYANATLQTHIGREVPLRWVFEAPIVADFALRLDHLQATTAVGYAPMRPVDRTQGIPLSFAQQRLWFLHQLDAESAAYNIPIAVRARGRLDPDVLERCVAELVARHESLRTTFVARDGEPQQVVSPTSNVRMARSSLDELPTDERERALRLLIDREARAPFDLIQGPLARVRYVRLADDDAAILVTVHHIVSDGWSRGVLIREVAALYDAFTRGRAPRLEPLPVQYPDFAVWQRGWLHGERLEEQLTYWRRRLEGAPPAITLPTDRPRPAAQTFRGSRVAIAWPADLSRDIAAFSRRESATVFMTLMAAFSVLLGRYSGQDDVVIGTPIANRTRPEVQPLIGLFANTLAFRADLRDQPSFRSLVQRVREDALGDYAHQDVPFERLVDELHVERDLGRTPIFQVMFSLQNAVSEELELPGVSLTQFEDDVGIAKFDLLLSLGERAGQLVGGLEYSSDLFDAATVQRMADHLRVLVRGLLDRPDEVVGRIPLLGEREIARALGAAENPLEDFGAFAPLHRMVEARVDATPDAIAVECSPERLTFGELERAANQLARRLAREGVRAGDRVGVAMQRSIDLVVALFAVLKTGAAYVPIDPTYPRDRIEYMVRDASLAMLLVPSGTDARLLPEDVRALPFSRADLADLPDARVSAAVAEDDVAYLIYTSGSTGSPKGSQLTHRAIVNHTNWMQSEFPLSPTDAVLQKTPISFDASVWEFWSPLCAGARLVMASPTAHQEPRALIDEVRRAGITTLQLVPTMLRVLLDDGEFAACGTLKRVFCGGEPLTGSLRDEFFATFPACTLVNLYGPTETAIDTVFHVVQRHEREAMVPIGHAVANTSAYVLDAWMSPVPIGVPGELFLGGEQVGRGYHERADLTAERFVPDPFSPRAGRRLYRTGDRVRQRVDGAIEFVGRMDHQVKLRGFRVELGEIESVIASNPAVREVAVVVREDTPGDRRLIAYVSTHEGKSVAASAIRDDARRRMPEYMVPNAVVVLDALPLTPSGKIDRKSLPRPSTENGADVVFVEPRTETEASMASIWRDVLGVERVSVHDDFFALGGHSLLAMRVISRIRVAFEIDVPVRSLFEHPTVAALADVVETAILKEIESLSDEDAEALVAKGRNVDD